MALRSILKKLAISLASLIVVMCAAEIVARLAEPGPFSFFDSEPYEKVPKMGHVHKPNFAGRWDGTWYGTDSHGLRGAEFKPAKTPDEYRVLAIGDSTTFGKSVKEADCWPRQLERMLDGALPAGKHALVANAGVNGYSARQYLQSILDRGPLVSPQLIAVGYCLNDFPNQTKAVDESIHLGKGNLRAAIPFNIREVLGRFALYRYLRATYYVMNRDRDFAQAEKMAGDVKGQGKLNPKRVADEIERLEGMASAARELNAQLCVFLLPYESQVYLENYDASAIDWLRGLCEQRGIPFVSMVDDFRARARSSSPPTPLFVRGDRYHPNPEGYGIVAARVLDLVRAKGWLPKAE